MSTSYEKLSTLLKELFQLDQADLDFGIYRIMNQKRDEISRFLDTELLPQVKEAFEQYRPADKKVLEEKLEQVSKSAIEAGYDPETSPKVKEIRDEIANYSVDTVGLENEVYSHLYNFFRRYYDEGDFISMRRYKEGVYAIPYEGEEVKLHWANADQYYIKTSENFKDYTFRLPSERLAHFKIVDAETEKDNVKAAEEKDRRFILAEEDPIQIDENDLILRFEYRVDPEKTNQKILNTLAIETILPSAPEEWAADLKTLAPTESNPRCSLLEKHLADYTARNTFDYFIHKDLSGFLRRELDFYIKNEVMRLDDIEDETAPRVEQYLSKIKALRLIAHKIIAFLAQIEDFQKRLWLKKKFVVETNYCITLDRVPEELYPEICANDAQCEEWVRLFAIEEIQADLLKPGFSIPLTEEFLKANPFLVLDTKFFDREFVDRLFWNNENIDEQVDGLLIHSENFQALSLLQQILERKIKCIYIDPPYNTSASEILYKNSYKHSSWLSLMANCLQISRSLLTENGLAEVAMIVQGIFCKIKKEQVLL
jgi:adenine-specific DNA-methyltransferase